MSRKLDMIYIIMMIFPLLITVMALCYMEDLVPAHYGMDNEVTRWGSKFELLITPIITVIFGSSMLWVSKTILKSKKNANNVLVNLMLCIGSVLIFDVLSLYFTYCAFYQITNLGDVKSVVYVALAVGYILCIVFTNRLLKRAWNKVD